MGGKPSKKQRRRKSLSDLLHIADVLNCPTLKDAFIKYLKKHNDYLCNYVRVWDVAKSETPNILEEVCDNLIDLDGFNSNELYAMGDNDNRKDKIAKVCEDQLNNQLTEFKLYVSQRNLNVD